MSSLESFFKDAASDSEIEDPEQATKYEIMEINLRIKRRRIRDQLNPLEMDDKAFLKHFRLSKEAFLYVLGRIDDKISLGMYNTKIPSILKLAITLTFCSHGSCQIGMETGPFGLAQPTVSVVMTEMLETMEGTLCPEFINFNSGPRETQETKLFFYRKFGIPGIIGLIDGTHIKIVAPRRDLQHRYMNQSGFFSINTMIVCDHKKRICCINAKNPGSVQKSNVFENSKLNSYLKYQNEENGWLLGDAGYELRPFLLVPFKDVKPQSPESRYNDQLLKCLTVMDEVIVIFRNQFRCLLGTRPLHYTPSKCTKIINVCAALYNICIAFNVPFNEELADVPEVQEFIHNENLLSESGKAEETRREVARSILHNSKNNNHISHFKRS